jgi:hypothetical protein
MLSPARVPRFSIFSLSVFLFHSMMDVLFRNKTEAGKKGKKSTFIFYVFLTTLWVAQSQLKRNAHAHTIFFCLILI